MGNTEQFGIFYKDKGIAITPIFSGSEKEVIEEWKIYREGTISLDLHIRNIEDTQTYRVDEDMIYCEYEEKNIISSRLILKDF